MKENSHCLYFGFFLFFVCFIVAGGVYAKSSVSPIVKKNMRVEEKWKGRIVFLISEPENGWYVDPVSKTRVPLFGGDDPMHTLETIAMPIQDEMLRKIPVADFGLGPSYMPVIGLEEDFDGDGLSTYSEFVFGTDSEKFDSDEDGYDDKTEILMGYNPLSMEAQILVNKKLTKQWSGKILSQSVLSKSVLWYVNPQDGKRYLIRSGFFVSSFIHKVGRGIGKLELSRVKVSKKYITSSFAGKKVNVKNDQKGSSVDSVSQATLVLSEDCGTMIERNNSRDGKRYERPDAEECIFHHFQECTPATYSYISYVDSESPYTLQSSYFEILGFAGNKCRVKIRDIDSQFPGDYLISKNRIGKDMVCAFDRKEESFKRMRATWAMENICTGDLYDILVKENQWHTNAALCSLKVGYAQTGSIGQSNFFEVVSGGDEQDIFWSSKDSTIVALDTSIGKKISVKFLKAGTTEVIVTYTASKTECSSLLPITVFEK